MRLVDWYLGLNLGQKIVVGVAVPVLVFVFAYLASIIILLAAGVGPEDNPSQQGGTPAPASLRSGASASVSSKPDYALKIEGARWVGQRAVVEGTWQGDISSVHCDLLEGGRAGRAIDWWDRSVAAKMSFPDRTFSQEFVRARGGDLEDRIDPKGEYWVTCWAQFSEGSAAADDAPVEGTPRPGEAGQ
jgi:hypothetical protein